MRWLFSHTRVYWYLWAVMLLGAFGNAALAAVVPVLTGQAIDAMSAKPPLVDAILPIVLWIAGTQVVRGVLQLGRNFGAEMIGQSMERDIRDELYVSLLGKSMTFHSLQPVGDTMARATTCSGRSAGTTPWSPSGTTKTTAAAHLMAFTQSAT